MEPDQRNELKELLNAFVDGDLQTPPLCTAATNGNVGLVVALLGKLGADKNFGDTLGETPLMKAADNGHLPVVETLLTKGVDVDTIAADGRSALMRASRGGYDEIVHALLDAGAHPYVNTIFVGTPLLEAAQGGHLSVVKSLLASGKVDASVPNQYGSTPLHRAAEEGYGEIANALLGAGARPDLRDNSNSYPLIVAIKAGHLSVVKAFEAAASSRYVDVNIWDSDGRSPLHIAAKLGQNEVVLALLRMRAAVYLGSRSDETPLMAAVSQGHLPVVETLLAAGADLKNCETERGYTALHYAARLNKVEIVGLLLRWGADETALTKNGKTPADLIDDSAPQAEAVRRLLARAPADRAWRRRGWLAMLRSRTLKAGGEGGSGVSSSDAGARSVKQRGGSGGGNESLVLSTAVGWLRGVEEGVFRNVVGFL